jgi:hypothetical protein
MNDGTGLIMAVVAIIVICLGYSQSKPTDLWPANVTTVTKGLN